MDLEQKIDTKTTTKCYLTCYIHSCIIAIYKTIILSHNKSLLHHIHDLALDSKPIAFDNTAIQSSKSSAVSVARV